MFSVVLGNDCVPDADRSVSGIDHFVQSDERVLEGERAGHDLERRARLVRVGDRAVASGFSRVTAVVVRVEGGGGRHRQDCAVRGIEKNCDARPGLCLEDGGGELSFHGELDPRVERHEERRAFLRRSPVRRFRFSVGRAARVGERDDLSRLAADRRVVEVLETCEPLVVGADVAEDRRGEPSLRVRPLRFGDEVHAGDLLGAQFRCGRAVQLSAEPDETFLLGQTGPDRRLGLTEIPRQDACRRRRVAHLVRDRIDRRRFDGDCERPALAIEDRSAQRGNFDPALLLTLCAGTVTAAFGELELRQTRDDDRRPEREEDDEEPDATETNEVHRTPLSRVSTY